MQIYIKSLISQGKFLLNFNDFFIEKDIKKILNYTYIM